jgi:3-hydroxyacyl-[acyl-carrier-protein] dehydratase
MQYADYQKILPQKEPFMFIDGIKDYDASSKILIAYKKFKCDEYFLKGHFPNAPLIPGVILIEALSQSCILCGYYSNNESSLDDVNYFEHLIFDVKIKFKNKCLPERNILLYSNLIGVLQNVSIFKVRAIDFQSNKIIAFGEIKGVAKLKGGAEDLRRRQNKL